jgi:hypothetical protein
MLDDRIYICVNAAAFSSTANTEHYIWLLVDRKKKKTTTIESTSLYFVFDTVYC